MSTRHWLPPIDRIVLFNTRADQERLELRM